MNILEEIIQHKYQEVADRKSLYPIKLLEQSTYFSSPTVSLTKYIQRADKSGIIAEIKRKSPSRGVINPYVSVERTSIGYMQAGASALSILTDKHYFGGSNDDLSVARKYNFCPILRKDFVVDEYQIVEAKSVGADAILLIAAALTPDQIITLADFAHTFQLEVLLEVHAQAELEANLSASVDLLGVNNRDLKTFTLDVDTSRKLADKIPSEWVKVSESGIEQVETVVELRKYGYQGFLMGQNFMQHAQPEKACLEFITELKRQENQ